MAGSFTAAAASEWDLLFTKATLKQNLTSVFTEQWRHAGCNIALAVYRNGTPYKFELSALWRPYGAKRSESCKLWFRDCFVDAMHWRVRDFMLLESVAPVSPAQLRELLCQFIVEFVVVFNSR